MTVNPTPEQFPEDEAFPLEEETTPVSEQKPPALVFSNSTYEILRAFVEVILPGLAAFYVALSGIWGFGHVAEVVGTVVALETLLGLLVRLARRTYDKSEEKYDGAVRFTDIPEQQRVDMALAFGNTDPKVLAEKKEITLKVSPPPTS